jgi:polysaccharide export outer membrane protein
MRPLLALGLAFILTFGGVALAAAAPETYVVHAGDTLHVDVSGEKDLSGDFIVAGDGTIGLPLGGEVRVGGATPVAASAAVRMALQRYVRDPLVSVSVVTGGHVAVFVAGAVVNSGEYELRPGAHLSDAIAAAGGMDPLINGEYPVARIAYSDGRIDQISLEKLLRGGDPTRDIALADRAVIYVPGPTTFDVTVMGAVNHPGTLMLREGDRLSIAIAKAGDDGNSHADLTRIMVTRTEPDGRTATHPVDLYRALEKGDTLFDPRLRKGDVVYVPAAAKSPDILMNGVFLLSKLLFL